MNWLISASSISLGWRRGIGQGVVFRWWFEIISALAFCYLGADNNGGIGFFIPFSIVLLVPAFMGRARQLQN